MGFAPITGVFGEYFQVVLADTPELRDQVYGVRYDVYCTEFGYEPRDRFPDRKERDEYDPISKHCLIIHKPSGMAAGCIRMVPADESDPSMRLPFEKHCGDSLDRALLSQWNLPRSSVCEISRLAVHKSFRRRAGEGISRYGDTNRLDFSSEEQRTLPYLAISAYLAATALGELTNRRNGFAMMEPFLPRLLGRVGIVFTRVGRDVHYRGLRGAYYTSTDRVLEGMHGELRKLYDLIYSGLRAAAETDK